jgi:hypothetical protein
MTITEAHYVEEEEEEEQTKKTALTAPAKSKTK